MISLLYYDECNDLITMMDESGAYHETQSETEFFIYQPMSIVSKFVLQWMRALGMRVSTCWCLYKVISVLTINGC
jgi:hypothetical protein